MLRSDVLGVEVFLLEPTVSGDDVDRGLTHTREKAPNNLPVQNNSSPCSLNSKDPNTDHHKHMSHHDGPDCLV